MKLNDLEASAQPVKWHEDHVAVIDALHDKIDALHRKFDALIDAFEKVAAKKDEAERPNAEAKD